MDTLGMNGALVLHHLYASQFKRGHPCRVQSTVI